MLSNYENYPSFNNLITKSFSFLYDWSYTSIAKILYDLYRLPNIIHVIFIYRKLTMNVFLISYFVYMVSEFGYLYIDYLDQVEIHAKANIESMLEHLMRLHEMYTILPEHAQPLRAETVQLVYRINAIPNFHDFLYDHENLSGIHNVMKQDINFASKMANVVKQDIINTYQAEDLVKTNEFINKGIKLATPFIGGVLALIAIYTVENLVPFSQGIFW